MLFTGMMKGMSDYFLLSSLRIRREDPVPQSLTRCKKTVEIIFTLVFERESKTL